MASFVVRPINGRMTLVRKDSVPRVERSRSALPCPTLVRGFDEPVQSMADGKFYTSKTALSRSYRAAHNPSGQDFVELGTEEFKTQEFTPDPVQRRNDVREAMNDVLTGNLPPEIAAIT